MSTDVQAAQLADEEADLAEATEALALMRRHKPAPGTTEWAKWHAQVNVLRTQRDYLAARADQQRLLVSLAAGGGG